MTDDELVYRRLMFMSLLSMQYHPRNQVAPADDPEIIQRCLNITDLAVLAFNRRFNEDYPS